MPMTCLPSLDFSRLRAPSEDCGVLIEPAAATWAAAARANAERLRTADVQLGGTTLADWRRRTRLAIVGADDALVIVTGHQPGFIHPGVWAKHVVATRFARAVGGVAVNLVVDCDAIRRPSIAVPGLEGERLVLRRIRFADAPADSAYEQLPLLTGAQMACFERSCRDALGERYAGSQMPTFFRALRMATRARDWVDQVVTARSAVERTFGVVQDDRRVSGIWCNALVLDVLFNAQRFADCYNRALSVYRKSNRIRGAGRPIPDLERNRDRCETALWAYHPSGPRRRLVVGRRGNSLHLFAGESEIGVVDVCGSFSSEDLAAGLASLNGWQLRPRALMLTIWARLLLADLFIHGIGGAKYDRISDAIIADYFGITAPRMVCASATLHMGLPAAGTTAHDVRRLRTELRDLRYNPQRHLERTTETAPLIDRRADAVRRSGELRQRSGRDRAARRKVFAEIREINAALLASRPESMSAKRDELASALQELRDTEISLYREYFFGLYDSHRLECLSQALPSRGAFGV
ncbi:MAG: hypothetical protein ACE5HE_08030 [Phycisphaerae bacterium]